MAGLPGTYMFASCNRSFSSYKMKHLIQFLVKPLRPCLIFPLN